MTHYCTSIDERLEEISQADRGKRRMSVIVLGAGMAGLATAYELQRLGHTVEILEGSRRVGGRVHTHYFADGTHGELGAMRIPASQDYTFHYIDLLDLPVGRFYSSNPNAFYDARGVVTRIKDAPETLFPKFDLSPRDRELANSGGVGAVVSKYLNMLVDSLSEDAIRSLFDLKEGNSKKYIARRMVDGDAYLDYLYKNVDTMGALDLVGVLQSLEEIWETSLTVRVRGAVTGRGNDLSEIIGGMSKLPEGLAERIGDVVRYRQEIMSIEVEDRSVKLGVRDIQTGACHSKDADFVVCTIPFSVLRRMELKGISQAKLKAIRTLNYASSSKVLLHCRERFWERSPYDLLGGASISQHISRQTYYPNDHHPDYETPWPGGGAKVDVHAFTLHPEQETGAGIETTTSSAPGVLLASYTWGMESRRIGALSHEERIEVMTRSLSRFHPEIDNFVDEGVSIFWDEHKWSMAAYSHPMPYDLELAFPAALQREGSLYFSGEHLSPAPGWIQGALYSALTTVFDIVQRFPET